MTLPDLISLCERAEGPSRELDRDIGQALLGWTVTSAYIETDEPAVYPNHPGAMYPFLTESVDAAIALAGRVLPGWYFSELGQDAHGFPGNLEAFGWNVHLTNEIDVGQGQAPTFPLAILIAVLRALSNLRTTP